MEEMIKCYLCNRLCSSGKDLSICSKIPDTEIRGCLNCGIYLIANDAIERIRSLDNITKTPTQAKLIYRVHNTRRRFVIPEIFERHVKEAQNKKRILPPKSPLQQDRLVFLLAEQSLHGWDIVAPKFEREGAQIGSSDEDEFKNVVKNLLDRGLISIVNEHEQTIRLTPEGMRYYLLLRRGGISGDKAFMAMAFNQPDLDDTVKKHFKSAVNRAGFGLVFADEIDRSGLIDQHIRDAIMKSAFVIADLSHGNQGVYFEAGFAEGLGKPVIYTCNEHVWKCTKKTKENVHFDVEHQRIITWNPDELQAFELDLAKSIHSNLEQFANSYAT